MKTAGKIFIAILLAGVICAAVIFVPKLFSFGYSYDNFYFTDVAEPTGFSDIAKLSATPSDIGGYTSAYKDCTGDYFRSALDEGSDEFYVYNAVLYAVENNMPYICIPEEYMLDVEEYAEIVTVCAADTPFLEFNFTKGQSFSVGSVSQDGRSFHLIGVPSACEADMQSKLTAYEQAKSIVAAMPDSLVTDAEKAEYIYAYIKDNISFIENTGEYEFDSVGLYDALCGDRLTICDGFAETTTMLMNLADIPSFAVPGMSYTGFGHAVNMIYADGVYYYCDPSADSGMKELGHDTFFSFMVPKTVISEYFSSFDYINDYLPLAATDGRSGVTDAFVTSGTLSSAVADASKALQRDGYIMVGFSDINDKELILTFERMLINLSGKKLTSVTRYGLKGYAIQN